MPFHSRLEKREYMREYRIKNRARLDEQKRAHRLKEVTFKQSLLAQFPCICCGETDHDLIDWHHVYPEDKKFLVSKWSANHEDWWDEVLKCVPVCALCHRKIHTNKLCLISPIGFKPL